MEIKRKKDSQSAISKNRHIATIFAFFTLILIAVVFLLTIHTPGKESEVLGTTSGAVGIDTDTELNNGSLTDVELSGTGSAASVKLAGDPGPDGTSNYRALVIDNESNPETLTNYQVKLNVDTSFAGVNDDCSDIRFTNDSGEELDYWIKEGCDTSETVIWVEVDEILGNADTTIRMYYGNPDATAKSSAADTFVYHESYEDTFDAAGLSSTVNLDSHRVVSRSIPSFNLDNKAIDFEFFTTSLNTSTIFGEPILAGGFATGVPNSLAQLRMYGYAYNGDNDREFGVPRLNAAFVGVNPSGTAHEIASDSSYNTVAGVNYRATRKFFNSTDKAELYLGGTDIVAAEASLTYDPATTIDTLIYGYGTDTVSVTHDPGKRTLDTTFFMIGHTVLDWDRIRVRNYSEPEPSQQGSLSDELPTMATNGVWESATGADSLDLGWVGDWGDGSNDSAVLSANVTTDSGQSEVAFSARVSASRDGLTSATYIPLGTAAGGSSFNVTRQEFLDAGVATGTDARFLQLRAELRSLDGLATPVLDGFSLNYIADADPPEINASAISMQRVAGGVNVPDSTGWANRVNPRFDWADAQDTESGIAGYCLYLGQNETADPTLTKGVLGEDDGTDVKGDPCPFIVSSSEIDFNTASFRGDPWLDTSLGTPYYLNIKAVNNNGQVVSDPSANFSFRYDSQNPTNPAFISLPSDFISNPAVTMTWPTTTNTATDNGFAGILGFQYSINDLLSWRGSSGTGEWNDVINHTTGSYTLSSADQAELIDGVNYIYVRVVDNAGNVSPYLTGTIKLNQTAPSAPLNLSVSPESNDANSYAFDWESPGTFVGLEQNLSYCYTVNELPSESSCNFTEPGQTALSADAYANRPGENTLYLVARDEAGNINYDVYAQVDFSYTGTAPGIASDLFASDISVKATENWRLNVSWDEPSFVGAGITQYRVYRSTTNTSCTQNFSAFEQVGTTSGVSYTDFGLTQQDYYYCVRACDSANNCSAVSETVNQFPDGRFTEPAELLSGPAETIVTTRTAEVVWTTARDSDSKVAFGTGSNDYFEEEPSNSEQKTDHRIRLTGLEPGTEYFYRAKWTDEDGNTGTSEEQNFVTRPAPSIQDVSIGNIGLNSALLQFTSIEANAVRVYYGLTPAFGAVQDVQTATLESTYTLNLEGLADGSTYYYKINPVDVDGFEYEGTVLNFQTLPRPRVSNVTVSEQFGTAQPTLNISWESNTPITSVVTYYPVDNPDQVRDEVDLELKDGVHEMSIAGLQADTTYIVTISGRDRLGNEAVSDPYRIRTDTDSRPPQITDIRIEGNIGLQSSQVDDESAAQLAVSWRTDEPATSQVEYGLGSGDSFTQSTQRDNDLSFNHTVVVSGLRPSQVYHLRPIATDSAGNVTSGIKQVTITPEASESAFNLVVGSLTDIFSFLE